MQVNDTLFKNFSNEDFAWKLDGREYTFKAGSATPMESAEAQHFAKHLVDREMGKAGLQVNRPERAEYLRRCLQDFTEDETPQSIPAEIESVETPSETGEQPFAEVPETTTRFCEECSSKGRVHKKECPKNPKNVT